MAHSSGRPGIVEKKEQFSAAGFRDSHGAFTDCIGQDADGYYFAFRQQSNRKAAQPSPAQPSCPTITSPTIPGP